MLNAISRNWWNLVIRGVFAILFGFIAIVLPGMTLGIMVFMFGAYIIVDGAFNIYFALIERDRFPHWWIGMLEGITGVVAGVLTFVWPGITGLILLYLIAFWALATGVLEIAAAIQLRKEISTEWLLGIGGVLSVIFGILLILSPIDGALAIVWLIGFYAIVFGGILIGQGIRLKGSSESFIHASQS